MKTLRTMAVALWVVVALSCVSCQKEKAGVYAPKKKIQRIYYSWNSTEKLPYQQWEWEDDRISSITHYANFQLKDDTWEEVFTYEDNRIKRVDNLSDGEYITYEYSDNHLRAATVCYHNYTECTWAVGYDGDHITKLTGTFYGKKKCSHEMHLNPLSHLFSPNLCACIAQCEQHTAHHRHHDGNYTISMQLVWEGGNISQIVYSDNHDVYTLQFQYDDKRSPWYGFMGGLDDYMTSLEAGSTTFAQHNVTTMVYKEEYYTDTICYSYQYDSDKYPILQTRYIAGYPDEKRVLYYEYN